MFGWQSSAGELAAGPRHRGGVGAQPRVVRAGFGHARLQFGACLGRIFAQPDTQSDACCATPVPEVVEACTVSGAADAVVHMLARDIPHLEQAIQRVRATAPVDRTESAIVLSRLLNRPRL
ncbi:hypothetical protein GCM10018966_040240 [Streptomyces yanii]